LLLRGFCARLRHCEIPSPRRRRPRPAWLNVDSTRTSLAFCYFDPRSPPLDARDRRAWRSQKHSSWRVLSIRRAACLQELKIIRRVGCAGCVRCARCVRITRNLGDIRNLRNRVRVDTHRKIVKIVRRRRGMSNLRRRVTST